jgi:hypothetical protein
MTSTCENGCPKKSISFQKNISDHSVGAYKELCERIDKTFEIIAAESSAKNDLTKCHFRFQT